jgi:hypothetical protein
MQLHAESNSNCILTLNIIHRLRSLLLLLLFLMLLLLLLLR